VDLGDVVPGPHQAHCHLDYTDMAGLLPPMRSFSDWIKAITALKGSWPDADFARSWENGADMLLRTGTTTVGDIEAVPASARSLGHPPGSSPS
jgi:cytosine/adenosine deaminase-related metal-dependent hydrolase